MHALDDALAELPLDYRNILKKIIFHLALRVQILLAMQF